MNLIFNNPWMSLHANSMRKLHKIEHLAFTEFTHAKLFKKGFINVAGIANHEKVQLMARQYCGDVSLKLKSLNSESTPYLDLFINVDGKYFQVSGVFNSFDGCNDHSRNRDDVGLMCSFSIKDSSDELHFMTSLTENKSRTKYLKVGG